MRYLVYQIQHNTSGKIYIGVHQTINPSDGYMGSGDRINKAIQKYGVEAFTKTILFDFDTPKEMFDKERELVNEEFIRRPDTYNIKVGGKGGWDRVNNDPEYLAECMLYARQTFGEKMKDPNFRAKFCASISRGKKRYYTTTASHWIGRKHTVETIAKQKQSAIGRNVGASNPLFGKKWMTNGIESKPATTEEQQQLLTSGWRYGRIINKNGGVA